MKRYLFLDVETTGFLNFKIPSDQQEHRVCQISGILCDDDLEILEDVTSYIQPDGWGMDDMPLPAFEVHGLTFEKLRREGRPIADVLADLQELENQASTRIAWNKRFDLKFLRGERRRIGMDDGYGTTKEFDPMWAAKPLVSAKAKNGKTKLPSLVEAYHFFTGSKLVGAHDAYVDNDGTRVCVRAMRDQYKIDIDGEMPKMFEEGETQAPLPPGARTGKPSNAKPATTKPADEPTDFDNLKVF